ncbi:hypothetical protein K1T71_011799 [Dendrolimus kikuchii]|uniref:Uncharacterized protein n=1 Tax=Dendrolimus kikuchii TaxID=765133 RepID=A0ACC1CMD2_9NEOP|nr:hypothetical protein K1T71_011799 [Dendrolimus kikuchii]
MFNSKLLFLTLILCIAIEESVAMCRNDPNAEPGGCGGYCGQRCVPRPCTLECEFNGCKCKEGYRYDADVSKCVLPHQCSQRAAIAQLVGSQIDNYITDTQLLSRGHLAAKTDFVFAFGERATFHYVNCAPQWTGFNGGNWNTLEVDLRNHIHYSGYDTIIYTGTYGVTQLFNQYGQRLDIYLTTDINDNPVIPVPQYFYKVVYEPSTQRGIAFVGLNNPYYTRAEAHDLFFCEDFCRGNRDFLWLTWHPDNPAEGYTFCCSIPDFRNTVHHLPQFEVTSILI